MAKLTIHPPEGEAVIVELNRDVITLGRDPENRIVISSSYISGFHARIHLLKETGTYEITDLGSHNGTRVNGSRIENRRLSHGDMIQFGPALVARFEDSHGGSPVVIPAGHPLLEANGQANGIRQVHGKEHEDANGSRDVFPRGEASAMADHHDELRSLKVEVKRQGADLLIREAQLKKVCAERDALLEAAAAQDRDGQTKAKEAMSTQERALRQAQKTQAELEAGIQRLRETRELELAALQKLREELAEYSAKQKESKENLETAMRERAAMAAQVVQKRDEQDSLSRVIAARRKELRHLEVETKQLPGKVESLRAARAERSNIDQATEAGREKLRSVESRLHRARTDESKLEDTLGRRRSELNALEAAVAAQLEIQRAVETAVAALRADQGTLQAQTEVAQASFTELTAALESNRMALRLTETGMEHQRAECRQVEQQLKATRSTLQACGNRVEMQQQQVALAETAVQTLRRDGEALHQEIHDAKAELEKIVTATSLKRAALQGIQDQLETFRSEAAGVSCELGSQGIKLKQLKEAESKAESRQRDLDRKIAVREARLRELEIHVAERERQPARAPGDGNPRQAIKPAEPNHPAVDSGRESINGAEAAGCASPQSGATSIEEDLFLMGFRLQPIRKNKAG